MNKNFFISLVVGVAFGVGTWYYLGHDTDLERAAKNEALQETDKTTDSFLRIGVNAIYVPDQAPGQRVESGLAALEAAGFVVIHEAESEKPGKVIGSSALLPAGETGNIPAITLSRETFDGETLFAMLHRDDGDGTFHATKDAPISDEGGEPFMMQFTIYKDAVEPDAVSL